MITSICMLKICGISICIPLKKFFDRALLTGVFPFEWKKDNSAPIHGNSNKHFVRLKIFFESKIFERFIFNKKFNFFSTNKLIFKNHSSFQTVDSCIKQLLSTVHEIVTSFDYELEVRSVLLDQSDAFGKVWQEELIFKLKQNGISGELLHIISVF